MLVTVHPDTVPHRHTRTYIHHATYTHVCGMVYVGTCVCMCAIVEAAKALGGSFKLVMLAPKTVREMTQLLRET